jgi:hypothetical protein
MRIRMGTDPLFPAGLLLPLADPASARVVARTTWTTSGPGEPLPDDGSCRACLDEEGGAW